jgi:pimeloyl-ACP methyl ester carboxylesterase
MSPRARTFFKLLKAFLPILLVIFLAFVAVCGWVVYSITRPPRAAYLVTPQTFSRVTGPILKAADVTWRNHDGTDARGWLIRGADGAPAVVLLHGYGADRSWLLNLAVKLNETTNFTVLWPDLRGHGENPPVNWTLFGGVEGDDVAAAIDYLRSLKTPQGKPQIGPRMGVYGIGLGSYAALEAARRIPEIRALALDSVPASPEDLVRAATNTRMGMNSGILQRLALTGIRVYGFGKFQRTPSCELARSLRDVRVLLLAGVEGDTWRGSSLDMVPCLNGSAEIKKDLSLTGANLPSSTGEQEETYDRPVIEFFDKMLR